MRSFSMVLHHRDLGGEGLPPLVILHGMLGSSRNWLTAGRDLSAHFHVFALDLRNHGQSPHADSMRYEEIADDVRGWLDARSLQSVTLLGHSMGGKTGMLLACRNPDRVARLFVVDIAPKDYFWPAHRATFAAMNELNLTDLRSREDAELRFEARIPSRGMRKFVATNLERSAAGQWRWLINLPVLTAALPELEKNSLRPEDCYTGPARFIPGGKSNYVEPADHAAIRRHFPAAEIRPIADSGHSPHIEAREIFVRTVLEK